jgi:hypothetical protein
LVVEQRGGGGSTLNSQHARQSDGLRVGPCGKGEAGRMAVTWPPLPPPPPPHRPAFNTHSASNAASRDSAWGVPSLRRRSNPARNTDSTSARVFSPAGSSRDRPNLAHTRSTRGGGNSAHNITTTPPPATQDEQLPLRSWRASQSSSCVGTCEQNQGAEGLQLLGHPLVEERRVLYAAEAEGVVDVSLQVAPKGPQRVDGELGRVVGDGPELWDRTHGGHACRHVPDRLTASASPTHGATSILWNPHGSG